MPDQLPNWDKNPYISSVSLSRFNFTDDHKQINHPKNHRYLNDISMSVPKHCSTSRKKRDTDRGNYR